MAVGVLAAAVIGTVFVANPNFDSAVVVGTIKSYSTKGHNTPFKISFEPSTNDPKAVDIAKKSRAEVIYPTP